MTKQTFSNEEIERLSQIDKDGYINCLSCNTRRTVDAKYVVQQCPQCSDPMYPLVPEDRVWEAINRVTIRNLKLYFESLVQAGATADEIRAKADDLAEGIKLIAEHTERE